MTEVYTDLKYAGSPVSKFFYHFPNSRFIKNVLLQRLLLFWLFFTMRIISYAQQDTICGFDAVMSSLLKQNPNLLNEMPSVNSALNNSNAPDEYIIPVVVHIIHNNGIENISDAQVFNCIDILNQIYQGDLDPAHRDTKIRFRLAQTDPKGCPTNGILRVQRPLTPCLGWPWLGFNNAVDPRTVSAWPKEKYLNIWVVYCTYGSAVADFPVGNEPAAGVIIVHHHVGSIGSAALNPNPGLIAHEVGHCLGLLHIWGERIRTSRE